MNRKLRSGAAAVTLAFLFPFGAASADSGFYFGGGVGNAGVDLDFQGAGFNIPNFDEDDFAWKVMGGYVFDLPALDLGVELAYDSFGEPSGDIAGVDVDLEPTGLSLFGIAGFDVGPTNVYGKLGYVSWDIEATLSAVGVPPQSVDDDGSDLAYGVGIRFGLASVEVRGEYEVFDIEDTEIEMVSAALVFYFD